MASSEDEGETVPHTVSNYHFVNDKNEPISFSELPVRWNDGEGLDGKRKQIFLHGDADKGLQKIHKQVMAWKFDLSDENPLILVLSKENKWIKLQKPRKSFEDTIRTILITVHCLHSVKKNPALSGRSLWDHLYKVFRSYEIRPSENDLIDHANIISEAVEKDETVAKSKFLVRFLKEKPRKKKALDEEIGTTANFIVDDDMIDEFEESDGSDEEDDLFDSVCAICDNGGDILCCEGRCMRSFHATVEAGSDSSCESLGLTNEHVDAIQNFFCKNCQYKRHQCFSCGELGSSDKSSGAEVFPCVSATCGRFYHPHCAAKLLHREIAAETEELQKKIADGESFTCPIHKCSVCKQGENKMDPDLQFAVCRRCPTSYHRKCLPKKIAFEDVVSKGIIQRAWEGLIPNRILIYCLKHELDDELRTPTRNHIKFPDDGQKNKKQVSERLQKREEVVQKKRKLDSADACRRISLGKIQKGVDLPSIKAEDGPSKKSVKRLTLPDPSKKQKVGDASVKRLNRSGSTKVTKSDENRVSLGDLLYNNYFGKGSVSEKSTKEDTPDSEAKQIPTDKPVAKEKCVSVPLDDASKRRILALVKDAGSSITLEKIIESHKMPKTYGYSSRNVVDKSLTLGKVEVSVEAICAALKELEEGCSVEDAKTVCEPGLLNQIIKWKNKLGGYLSPFLNGARYTSHGRHFTKVDKLKEIVDLLHCYVQDGDMMVDFCCGSNDFSLLMKEKLDKIGTRCSYKNYDLVQAKNNFNFEKRDWMTVRPNELPTGSKLIMGLNPPFGKNARDANKFIDKALEFKPKLLILIAPPETERLDKKNPPYDLIWEDDEMLAGKSFYLPGSVDVNDNQLDDWNVNTSLLNLWSRPDWTAKHKAIAQRHGHLNRLQEQTHSETQHETLVSDKAVEVPDLNGEIPMSSDGHKEGTPSDNKKREVHEHSKSSHGKNCSKEDPKKRRRDEAKPGRESSETLPAFKEPSQDKERGPSQERGPSPRSKMYNEHPRQSQPREVREQNNSSLGKNRSDEDSKKRLPDKGKRGGESSETSPSSKERGLSHERGQSPLSKRYDKHPRLSPPREVHQQSNSSLGKNRSDEDSKKRLPDKGKCGRESSETSPSSKERGPSQERGQSPLSKRYDKRPRLSPPRVHQHSNSSPGKNRSNEDLKKRQPDRGNRRRESSETSSAFKERGLSREKGQSPLSETYDKLPRLSPPIVSRGRSLEDGNFSEPLELGHYLPRYGENRVDDIDRVYSLSREERVPGGTHVWPSGTSPSRGHDYGHIFDYGVRNPAVTEGHVLGGTRGWPSGASPGQGLHYGRSLDYGVGNLSEQFPGYQRETMDNGGHRSYISELEHNYPTDSAIRSDTRLYGQQQQYHDTLGGQRSGGYLGIGDPGLPLPYGHLNSAAGSSNNQMSTSAMQRYLPQLDEMNHTRVNPLAAVPPHHAAGRNGIPDPHAPTAGYRVDSMGFAPGSYHRSYPEHNSSGWLN